MQSAPADIGHLLDNYHTLQLWIGDNLLRCEPNKREFYTICTGAPITKTTLRLSATDSTDRHWTVIKNGSPLCTMIVRTRKKGQYEVDRRETCLTTGVN